MDQQPLPVGVKEKLSPLKILEKVPVAFSVLIGSELIIKSANPKQLELWQKSAAEVLDKPLFTVLPEVASQEFKRLLHDVLRTGKPYQAVGMPAQFLRNGTLETAWFDFTYEPLLDDTGEVEGIVVVSTEVTEKMQGVKDNERQLPGEKEIVENLKQGDDQGSPRAFSQTILESSPDCVKLLDSAGHLQYMNANGVCLMELDNFCQVEGKPWWELWAQESREIVKAAVQKALAGEFAQFQGFCPTGKGTPKWWDVRVSPLRNQHGSVTQLISISRDVTQAKQDEEAMRIRNGQLNLLARTAQRLIRQSDNERALLQSVFEDVCQTTGLEIFFNYLPDPECKTLHLETSGGLLPEEVAPFSIIKFGEHLCGRVAAQRKPIVVAYDTIADQEGTDAFISSGITAYAGFPLLVGKRLIGTVSFATRKRTHFVDGEIQTIQTVCDQLAATIESQRLHKEVAESNQRFRMIFNHQYQFSALLTAGGEIVDISDSAIHMAGISKAALIGTSFIEGPWFVNLPEVKARWMAQFEEAINTPVTSHWETPFQAPGGSLRYALNTASAIRNTEGFVQYLLVESIDITERKQIEQALQESENQFRLLFQYSPVSKWIEDYTHARKEVMALKAEGITDFKAYFEEHPQKLQAIIASIVVKDVNDATLELYGGPKQELLNGLQNFFVTDTLPAVVEQIGLIAAGGGRYESETIIKTHAGVLRNVLVRIDFPAGDEYSNLIVALLDVTERKELEQRLRMQYDELENIYRNAPIGLAMVDREFRFVRINEKLAEINGISVAGHIGRKIDEIVPDLAGQAKAIFQQIFDTGEPVLNVEIKGQTNAEPGVNRIWNESWHPVKNESGQTFAVSIVVEEITERKKTEEALRQSEEQMRLVLDASMTGIWIINLITRHIYWSPQHYTIFGVSEFDGNFETFKSFVHPEDLPRVWAAFNEAIQNGGQYRAEFRIVQPSGHIRWVGNHGHCEYDGDGNPVRFLGLAQDITDRKEAEQELAESEARFRTLAEALPQLVWTADAKGNILFSSKYWVDYSGIAEIRASWNYMIHPDDLPVVMESWQKCLAAHEPYRQQLRLRNSEGQYRWHYSIADPLFDGNGTLIKWIGAMTDIHVQKTFSEKLEELVAERTKDLQRSNEDLQQFAHVSSHDLKEPVRKVRIFASRLETEFDNILPDRAKQYLERIGTAARRSYDMIEGVLRYSMITNTPIGEEKVDVRQLFRAIETDQELLIAEKQAALCYSDLPLVAGSDHLLHQLFYNLVGNALKFAKTTVPPQIMVEWRVATVDDIRRLDLLEHVRYACISVQDNGIGFESKYAEHIFKTFCQLNAKEHYEGTGLGLALCKKIVERHHGAIEAEGKAGVGATFRVYLPMA